MPYRQFANVETNMFPELAQRFQQDGSLSALEFWAILKWKANRASTTHRERLTTGGETFSNRVAEIAQAIFEAHESSARLGAVMRDEFGFRLATASAVLSVLYPEEYTIYDERVCREICHAGNGDFSKLRHRRFTDALWRDYVDYVQAAVASAPAGLLLREVDQYLWGKSWARDASEVLGLEFVG